MKAFKKCKSMCKIWKKMKKLQKKKLKKNNLTWIALTKGYFFNERLKSLKNVKPAYMEEYESLEKELEKLYNVYLVKIK